MEQKPCDQTTAATAAEESGNPESSVECGQMSLKERHESDASVKNDSDSKINASKEGDKTIHLMHQLYNDTAEVAKISVEDQHLILEEQNSHTESNAKNSVEKSEIIMNQSIEDGTSPNSSQIWTTETSSQCLDQSIYKTEIQNEMLRVFINSNESTEDQKSEITLIPPTFKNLDISKEFMNEVNTEIPSLSTLVREESPLKEDGSEIQNEKESSVILEDTISSTDDQLREMIKHSLTFFNVDVLPNSDDEEMLLQNKDSSLSASQMKELQDTKKSYSSLFHLFQAQKTELNELRKRMSPEVKHFQADNPAATLLVVPQRLSGAPAIFLKTDTPCNTPAESPDHNSPNLTFEQALNEQNMTTDGLDSPSLDESSGEDTVEITKPVEEPRPLKRISSFYSRMNILKNKVRRPTLHLLPPLKQIKEKPDECQEKQRRYSTMSTLSITHASRRPSLTSLLSLSPSSAGRKFSFNIGSRVSSSSF